ncbi:MAG TPA: type I 3-dehydroquinate dehydratase [Chthoniobacterales bacterium]|jgi:3-dehydroquinate dehydratase-1
MENVLSVGVIFSRDDLQRAIRMQNPPDLFELRLDALAPQIEKINEAVAKLPARFVVTARHPREGGVNNLSAGERRALLLQFLPRARYIDIELRSARAFAAILKEARAKKIGAIISFHDFDKMPSRRRLDEVAHAAHSLGADILKIAIGIETAAELGRTLEFFQHWRSRIKIAAMGIGRFGRISRITFAQTGSALNYVHLGVPQAEGQLSLAQLRRALR